MYYRSTTISSLCVLCSRCRTDRGHSCIGPEKSYRSCNIQVQRKFSIFRPHEALLSVLICKRCFRTVPKAPEISERSSALSTTAPTFKANATNGFHTIVVCTNQMTCKCFRRLFSRLEWHIVWDVMLYIFCFVQQRTPVSYTAFPEERISTTVISLLWWTALPVTRGEKTSVWRDCVRSAQRSTIHLTTEKSS